MPMGVDWQSRASLFTVLGYVPRKFGKGRGKNFRYLYTNLFKGDKQMGNNLNQVLNENCIEIFEVVKKL
jgi:hypothetical protein